MDIKRRMAKFGIAAMVLAVVAFICMAQANDKRHKKELSIGERFHYETSLTWRGVLGDMFRGKPKKPAQYKTYPASKKVKLPAPTYQGLVVEEAIKKQRSVRDYSTKAVNMDQLFQLLFAAQGITGRIYGQPPRSAP